MFPKDRLLKGIRLHIYSICAGVIILLAAILRVVLVALGWNPLNSDEAFMDLAALHIEKLGEHPSFFYGQNYLGALDAYMGSLLFRILGPSAMTTRLVMIAFTLGFFVLLYIITSKLYTKRFALVIVGILCCSSSLVLARQIEVVGYPELPLFAAALFLVAYTVAFSYHQLALHKRVALYLLWGLLAGLAIWVHYLTAPYILVSGLMILVFCWRDLLKWSIWLILIGCLIGAAPLIYYNFHAAAGQNSLDIFQAMSQMGNNPDRSFLYHLEASILVSLPVSLGYTSSCLPGSGAIHLFAGPHPARCVAVQSMWGGGYLILLACGFILAIVAFRRAYSFDSSVERHQQMVQQFAQLMLLCGAILTLFFYIKGNAGVIDPVVGWRYLICTLLSLPAVLWALWSCDQYFKTRVLRAAAFAMKWCVLLLVVFSLIEGTVQAFQQVAPTQAEEQSFHQLEQTLLQMHITRFYSEYWTCARVIFDTQERLICGNTHNDLTHGFDRYLPYRSVVEQDPTLNFVYPDGSPQISTLNQYLARYHITYERFEVDGFAIYKLSSRIPLLNL